MKIHLTWNDFVKYAIKGMNYEHNLEVVGEPIIYFSTINVPSEIVIEVEPRKEERDGFGL